MPYSPRKSNYLRALFEQLDIGVLIADDEARYLDVNPAGCELLGRPRDEIVGKTVYDLVDEWRRDSVRAQWEAFLRDGSQSGVFEANLPDGTTRSLEFHARANFLPGFHCSFLAAVAAPLATSEKTEMITMCAWTKRVKLGDDWVPVEEYLEKAHGILVSHGISPGAFERLED